MSFRGIKNVLYIIQYLHNLFQVMEFLVYEVYDFNMFLRLFTAASLNSKSKM